MKLLHKGFLYVGASKGAQAINGALYNTLALNYLANAVGDECKMIFNKRFNASSVTPLFVTTTLISDLILVPAIVARLDSTEHRLKLLFFGHFSWILLVLFGAILLATATEPTEATLVLYFISLCLVSLTYEILNIVHMAYLPEIASTEQEITQITSKHSFLSAIMGILLAGIVTVFGMVFSLSDTQLGAAASFGVVFFWLVWSIPGIPAMIHLEKGMTVAVAPAPSPDVAKKDPSQTRKGASASNVIQKEGILKVFKLILRDYRDIALFLIAYALFMPAVGNLIVLVTGYLQNAIGYTGNQISMLSIIVVVVSAPSAFLTQSLQKRIGIKKTLVLALALWTVCSIATPWTVGGEYVRMTNSTAAETNATTASPSFNGTHVRAMCGSTAADEKLSDAERDAIEQGSMVLEPNAITSILVPCYAILWGVGIGMIFSSSTAMFAIMVPGGKEASFFACKTFSAKIVAWSPSMIYTIINEVTGNLDLAMFSLSWFFVISFPLVLMIDMTRSDDQVKPTLQHRRRSSLHPDALAILQKANEEYS